ncbi:FG-GAP-like repeat-containing protein [Streptomyces sp. NPDC056661]|uniref:FG-GAP-like repeat-containing protein n=1 Tax=Streptomyces sp. NPDC056661 TaxID=3345898 RepID=UPI0036C92431
MMDLAATWGGRSRARWLLARGVALSAVWAVTVSGVAWAELPLPVKDPSKVVNPSATVSAGSERLGGSAGSASVSDTGVAGYEIPLTVVPGRGGLQPRLSLKYSSQSGNGQVGVGFGLAGVSQISLCAKTFGDDQMAQGVQLFGSGPFCLNGQRLVPRSGQEGADGTEYRTLPDTHVRVKSFRAAGTPSSEKGPTSFKVWLPEGTVETYGDSGRTKVLGAGSTVNTAWTIQSAEDRSGNAMSFTYGTRTVSSTNPSEVERWIDSIRYGTASNKDRLVEFGYETRPDAKSGFSLGQRRESSKRLKSVTMSLLAGGQKKRARSYTLSYLNDGMSKASKLSRVRECSVGDGTTSGSECKRDTQLTWTAGSEGFLPGKKQTTPSGGPLVPPSVSSQIIAADFDADGRTDVAWPEAADWKYVRAQAASDGQVYTGKTNGPAQSVGVGATAWPLDYDGDGRTDLLPRYPLSADNTWRVFRTKSSGAGVPISASTVSTPFTGPFNFSAGQHPDAGAFPGDFDGDGYQDVLMYQRRPGTDVWDWTWRRNTGTVHDDIASTPAFDDKVFSAAKLVNTVFEDPDNVTVVDIFGDGRDQMLHSDDNGHLWATDVGTLSTTDTLLPPKLMQLDKQWLDVNGDGLVDLLTNGSANGVKGSQLYYWLNTGRGFTAGVPSGVASGGFKSAQVMDYDGDGRRDLLVPRLAGGAQFEPLYDGIDVIRSEATAGGAAFTRTATTITFDAMSTDDYKRQGLRTVDANGDGLTDVLLVNRPPLGTSCCSPALMLYLHKTDGGLGGDRPDLLWRVYEGGQNPKGALGDLPPTAEFRYAPLTDTAVYSFDDCARVTGFACQYGGGLYVVSQVRRDSGIDNHTVMVSDYFYRKGRTDRFRRSPLGFSERMVTTYPAGDASHSVMERSFYDNTLQRISPRLAERWVIHKLPGGRQRLERTENDWSTKGTGADTRLYFTFVRENRQRSYEFATVGNLATLSPAAFDALGKTSFRSVTSTVSGMDEYGNAGTTDTHSVSVDNVRESKTTVTLTPDVDVANWLVRRPQKVVTVGRVVDPATGTFGPAQTRTRSYTYEGATDRVDTVKSYASDAAPGRQLLTSFDYEVGNVIRRTGTDLADGTVSETTYAYDGFGYPHAVQNGRQQTSYTGYDPVLGVLKVAVDVNGLRTDYTYDTLGRLVKTRSPSGAESTVGYSLEVAGSENLIRVEGKDGTGAVTQTVIDRLGRPVIERFKGFDSKMRQRKLTYEPQGMLDYVTTFHPVGTAVTDKITYDYDDLGRVVEQRDPFSDAPRTWEYNALTTTYTDTRGHTKTTTVDHNGQVVAQTDKDGSSGPPTRVYRYGPFGTLISTRSTVFQATETVYSYDDQGALISSTDGERGTTAYGYNAFGEVTAIDDANGRHTAVTYDVLGRETLRATTKNGTSTSTVTHTWDTVTGRTLRGALMQVTSDDRTTAAIRGSVTTDYTYDTLGRLDQVSQTQPQSASPTASLETLTADYDYDTFYRLTGVRYPKLKGQSEGVKVDYVYGPAATSNGHLTRVQAGTETLWQPKDTDDQDRLVEEESGDGVTTSRSLDWNGQVLNTQSKTSDLDDEASNITLFDENYTYDDEGNLETRSQGTVTEEFTYDSLDRLATAKTRNPTTGTVYQTDDWNYDKLGNLISSELRGTYTYGQPARPHLVTQAAGGLFGTRGYGYDAVGNQTTRPGATVTYNDLNLPSQLTPTSGTATSFLYDGNGERVRKTGNQGTITYLPGLYERHQNGTGTEHRLLVPAQGTTGATLVYKEAAGATTVTKQPTLYTHTDHLGSPRLVTKNTGPAGHFQAAVVEKRSYDALGKLRNPDLTHGDDQYTTGIQPRTLHQGYTGHDEDDELGLVNMHARIYDPTLGRFTTPDTVIDGANPTQAYNRYTYGSNNPLKYTDPTGHGVCTTGSNCQTPECKPGDNTCTGGTSTGGTSTGGTPTGGTSTGGTPTGGTSTGGTPTGGTNTGGTPTQSQQPHDPHDEITTPGAGDPNAGDDEIDNDGCDFYCNDNDSEPGGQPHTAHHNPNHDPSDCEPLCRDEAGIKDPSSSPTQTNAVTPADSSGNQATTDITGDTSQMSGFPPRPNGRPWGSGKDYLKDPNDPRNTYNRGGDQPVYTPNKELIDKILDEMGVKLDPEADIKNGVEPVHDGTPSDSDSARVGWGAAALGAAAGAAAVAGSLLAGGGWVLLFAL